MSTVFPDTDAAPVASDVLLEQPTAALAAIATAASAGVSLLPFKVFILSFDRIIRLPGLKKYRERQFGIKCESHAAQRIPKRRPTAPGCQNARL
jgi:hypothetical protein